MAADFPRPTSSRCSASKKPATKSSPSKAAQALQYGTTEGYQPLREMIAHNIARYGIVARAENVLITSGSQQALDLIGKLLINRGDRILVEAPTYLGALQAFNVYGAQYVSVPVDNDGLLTDQLDRQPARRAEVHVRAAEFPEPGRSHACPKAAVMQLILLADKYGIPIVEDDPYGQLRYEGEHIAPLVVLDRENLRRDNGFTLGNVIYLSTFSKTLAPGIRLAWIVAPEDVISKLVQLKQAADLHTSTFNQYVAYEVARDGFLDQHVKLIRQVYRERRDAMLQRSARVFPARSDLDPSPRGSLSLGDHAGRHRLASSIPRRRWPKNVAFVPGDSFYANNGHEGGRHMRLNFSHCAARADSRRHSPPVGRSENAVAASSLGRRPALRSGPTVSRPLTFGRWRSSCQILQP